MAIWKQYGKLVLFLGAVILLCVGLFQLQQFWPRTDRAGEPRQDTPMAPALVAAIRDADAEAVGKLIESGVDVNARDAEGNTPLILAAFYAGSRCVELLLGKGADPNAANRFGVTALIRAAMDYEKTRLLINAGAKVGYGRPTSATCR